MCLALLPGAAGCPGHGGTGAARASLERTAPVPCTVEGVEERLLCGKLPVWENRQRGEGRIIELSVVILPSLEARPVSDPIFVIEGGPGIGAARNAAGWIEARALRQGRDIVLVDQRGTGGSNPLHCDLQGDAGDPRSYLLEMYPVEAVKACRAGLEKKADLTQYTTSIAMADLDDVREWLGYESVNLLGLSYGTRAAQEYMRQHPQRVRSAILLGALPMSVSMPLDHARMGQRAMDLLFEDCAADAACRAAFPDPALELRGLLERLGSAPARATYQRVDTDEPVEVSIGADVLAEQLRSLLYAPATSHTVPWIIHAANGGDFAPFLKSIVPGHISPEPLLAEGLYLSITSAEDVPFIAEREIPAAIAGTFLGDYRIAQQRRAGEHWPRARVPARFKEPVSSTTPVLIFAGGRDPITPPAYAEEIAGHMPNARLVVIPGMAHSPGGLSRPDCLDEIAASFLDDPRAADIGEGCISQMTPPPFVLTGETGSTSR